MHRGLQALILSRRRASPSGTISTGFVGNQYSDITHEILQQNRARLWALGGAFRNAWDEHETLFNRWMPFYASPMHEPDPDGMTSPQRELWFREQAVMWSSQIAAWEPRKNTSDNSIWPYALLGLVVLGGIGIATQTRK